MYLGFREFVYFVAIHNRVLDITNFDFLLISLKRKYQFHKTNKTIAVVWLLPKQKPMDLVEHIRLDLYTKVFTCWDALWDMQQTYLTFLGWYLFHSFTLRCKKCRVLYSISVIFSDKKESSLFWWGARLYLLPELLHYDVNQLHLEFPGFVHGAQIGSSHTVGHYKPPEITTSKYNKYTTTAPKPQILTLLLIGRTKNNSFFTPPLHKYMYLSIDFLW